MSSFDSLRTPSKQDPEPPAAWSFSTSQPPNHLARINTITKLFISVISILLFISVFAFFASFPLVVLLSPETNWTPEGIKCASCEEIVRYNLEVGKGLGCRGWDYMKIPAKKHGIMPGEVTFDGMKRCWRFEDGKDEWLNAL